MYSEIPNKKSVIAEARRQLPSAGRYLDEDARTKVIHAARDLWAASRSRGLAFPRACAMAGLAAQLEAAVVLSESAEYAEARLEKTAKGRAPHRDHIDAMTATAGDRAIVGAAAASCKTALAQAIRLMDDQAARYMAGMAARYLAASVA